MVCEVCERLSWSAPASCDARLLVEARGLQMRRAKQVTDARKIVARMVSEDNMNGGNVDAELVFQHSPFAHTKADLPKSIWTAGSPPFLEYIYFGGPDNVLSRRVNTQIQREATGQAGPNYPRAYSGSFCRHTAVEKETRIYQLH